MTEILQAYRRNIPAMPAGWQTGLTTGEALPLQAAGKRPAGVVVQRLVQVAGEDITEDVLTAAIISAFKSEWWLDKQKKTYLKKGLTDLHPTKGILLKNDLWAIYQTLTLNLTDNDSLIHQVGQDIYLYLKDNRSPIIGTPHQQSEYAMDPTRRHPGHVGDRDMRIYRSMPKYAWDAASLKGHGGSLGEAMNYFQQQKRDTAVHANHVYYLVEFRLPGKALDTMVGTIGAGGEGARSTADKFGGKKESTSEFGIEKNFFSVDMEHAATILSAVAGATSRVVASTGVMPAVVQQLGSAWNSTNQVDKTGW